MSLLLAGCTTGSLQDVSHHPLIQRHIGRTFVLKEDLYLYIRKGMDLEYPLLGPSKSGPLGLSQPRLPTPVSTLQIGFEDPQIKIMGVLVKGTTVRFDQILRLKEPTDEYFFIILETSDKTHPKAEYFIPAIGSFEGARKDDFSQSPWFFTSYSTETAHQ